MHTVTVQIPCYNESETIPGVLRDIKSCYPSEINVVVIDDGSTDNTAEIAVAAGADFVLKHSINKGLAEAFRTGIEHAYKTGADILINMDGDHQYPARYIPDLVKPILEGEADIVIGNRQTSTIEHFSPLKRLLQWVGTRSVSLLLGEPNIKDAVSGFRAYNRTAMREINVIGKFSYVLDTIIQAKVKGLRLASVDITTNPPTRPSRLFRSSFHHIRKSAMDIIRVYAMYRGMRFFFWVGIVFLFLGSVPMVRFLLSYLAGRGDGMVQSLIFGAMFIIISAVMFALGIIADLQSKNRNLIERLLQKQKDSEVK